MEKLNGNLLFQYLATSDQWKQGYKTYHKFLNKPLGWFNHSEKEALLKRLNRKECCTVYSEIDSNQVNCIQFISDTCSNALEQGASYDQKFFRCYKNRKCALIPLAKGSQRGFIVFCSLKGSERALKEKLSCFIPFLNSEIDSYQKLRDLHNVYETVHPRALALSSLHSVNRVISSSLNLDDLIPKVGRLCAQILKAQYCSIFLVDDQRKWLIPHFILDANGVETHGKKYVMGKGLLGRVAAQGEYYIARHCISLPLIDDDVIGVLTVKNKVDKQLFTRSDVEVLKALSEQAVVAIRNSQLLEEHERITLGSIKSINNILDINLPRDKRYTYIFSTLVYELVKYMGLPKTEILNIQRAASLLDTGHLGIPESIRVKEGTLTKREYQIIKTHPYRGVEIIQSIDSLKPVIPIILYHHERYDGKGYPEGLHGEEIPPGARIMSLIVAFTAMITKRPYREAKSIEEALQEIEQLSGTQFDPHVVKYFLALMKEKHIINLIKGQ
ncbi:MAG: GAF domain-containing protein [Candidatus Omnitrophica bacterium]|nr:GAF domain-containing protein [Candidatus Omnitrophota bacterium]